MVTYVFLQIETVKAVNLSFKDVAFRETQKTVKLAGSAQLGERRASDPKTIVLKPSLEGFLCWPFLGSSHCCWL